MFVRGKKITRLDWHLVLHHQIVVHLRTPSSNIRGLMANVRNYFQTDLINLEPKTSSGKWWPGQPARHLAEIAGLWKCNLTFPPWSATIGKGRERCKGRNMRKINTDLAPALSIKPLYTPPCYNPSGTRKWNFPNFLQKNSYFSSSLEFYFFRYFEFQVTWKKIDTKFKRKNLVSWFLMNETVCFCTLYNTTKCNWLKFLVINGL